MKKAKTAYGDISVFENDRIGREFLSGNHYEIGLSELLVSLCENKRVAVDVGANIGSHTIVYAKYFQNVHAFEVQKIMADVLKINVSENVAVHNVALSHKRGVCTVVDEITPDDVNYGARGIGPYGTEHKMHTLDSYNLKHVDLIKIDTEGSEMNVLAGAQETIRRYKPVIMYEYHGILEFARRMPEMYFEAYFQILPFLLEIGYTKFSKHGKNIICTL